MSEKEKIFKGKKKNTVCLIHKYLKNLELIII